MSNRSRPAPPISHASLPLNLNLNNLATLTTTLPDFAPRLINGRPLKVLYQFYNNMFDNSTHRLLCCP